VSRWHGSATAVSLTCTVLQGHGMLQLVLHARHVRFMGKKSVKYEHLSS